MVEDEFGVEVSRVPMVGKNKYGSATNYVNYRLNNTEANAIGRQKMVEYVKSQMSTEPAKTEKSATQLRQTNLFLNQ